MLEYLSLTLYAMRGIVISTNKTGTTAQSIFSICIYFCLYMMSCYDSCEHFDFYIKFRSFC